MVTDTLLSAVDSLTCGYPWCSARLIWRRSDRNRVFCLSLTKVRSLLTMVHVRPLKTRLMRGLRETSRDLRDLGATSRTLSGL